MTTTTTTSTTTTTLTTYSYKEADEIQKSILSEMSHISDYHFFYSYETNLPVYFCLIFRSDIYFVFSQ